MRSLTRSYFPSSRLLLHLGHYAGIDAIRNTRGLLLQLGLYVGIDGIRNTRGLLPRLDRYAGIDAIRSTRRILLHLGDYAGIDTSRNTRDARMGILLMARRPASTLARYCIRSVSKRGGADDTIARSFWYPSIQDTKTRCFRSTIRFCLPCIVLPPPRLGVGWGGFYA